MNEQSNKMLFARQKRLLALLHALGGDVGNLDFQKLLFLYWQESDSPPDYEFVPYRFGAFSFTSYADRRSLVERGLIDSDEQKWKLTKAGWQLAGKQDELFQSPKQFSKRYRNLRGDALIHETYRRFPYYGIRSEIVSRILSGDPETLRSIQAACNKKTQRGIATIGYEGRSLENYLNKLLTSSVTTVCDVRRNPSSRKYGFAKSTLSRACDAVGIRYEHLPELGIASEQRRDLKTQDDYDRLFRYYERNLLPKQKPKLRQIHDWVKRGELVALTCFERLPEQCHRKSVAKALEDQFGVAYAAIHL